MKNDETIHLTENKTNLERKSKRLKIYIIPAILLIISFLIFIILKQKPYHDQASDTIIRKDTMATADIVPLMERTQVLTHA